MSARTSPPEGHIKNITINSSPKSLPPPSPNTSVVKSCNHNRRSSAPNIHQSNQLHVNENVCSQRVFKKSSPNSKITLYLSTRDIVISEKRIDKLRGVILIDPEFVGEHKVFGQLTLTFRYGREDEEVMGLRFCNEAIMAITRLYPLSEEHTKDISPLQDALLKRLGSNSYPFSLQITPFAPPSVQLVPAKEYRGAPIGTSYDVRAFVADRADEKTSRRGTVRMGIRVLQRYPGKFAQEDRGIPARATIERPFLLSDGRLRLEAGLDKASYRHGEAVHVKLTVHNRSTKTVRRIKILVVQHVDVCMFSNGKFKNIVALINSHQDCPINPGTSIRQSYALFPTKGATKNWIALEDSYSKQASNLASTVQKNEGPEISIEKNVFAIYVTYYVKIKLIVGAIGSKVSVKLPFDLLPSEELDITDPSDALLPTSTTKTGQSGTSPAKLQTKITVEVNTTTSHASCSGISLTRPTKIVATTKCSQDNIESTE